MGLQKAPAGLYLVQMVQMSPVTKWFWAWWNLKLSAGTSTYTHGAHTLRYSHLISRNISPVTHTLHALKPTAMEINGSIQNLLSSTCQGWGASEAVMACASDHPDARSIMEDRNRLDLWSQTPQLGHWHGAIRPGWQAHRVNPSGASSIAAEWRRVCMISSKGTPL